VPITTNIVISKVPIKNVLRVVHYLQGRILISTSRTNSGTETTAYTTHFYINVSLQSIHTNIFLRVWIVKRHSPMLTIHNTNQSDGLPQITKHANKTDNKIDKIVLVPIHKFAFRLMINGL
jgi:hypothetical protein